MVVSNIFYVHPYPWKIPNLTDMFSNGLKAPTSYIIDFMYQAKSENSSLVVLG